MTASVSAVEAGAVFASCFAGEKKVQLTGKEAHAICVMCLIKWKAEALKKALQKALKKHSPLGCPPAKGLFLSAHFHLIFSKMPSRIHLKLSNETKIKKGIE